MAVFITRARQEVHTYMYKQMTASRWMEVRHTQCVFDPHTQTFAFVLLPHILGIYIPRAREARHEEGSRECRRLLDIDIRSGRIASIRSSSCNRACSLSRGSQYTMKGDGGGCSSKPSAGATRMILSRTSKMMMMVRKIKMMMRIECIVMGEKKKSSDDRIGMGECGVLSSSSCC